MSDGIKSTEVARVKPASEEQSLIIGAIRHDRVSGEIYGGDGPDGEILDEVLANPASSGQAPRAPKSISSRDGRYRLYSGNCCRSMAQLALQVLGWLGNPGKHRRDSDFRSEAPRIVLLVAHKEILDPFSLLRYFVSVPSKELGTQIVAGIAQPRLRA
jgi:hypothetical protein